MKSSVNLLIEKLEILSGKKIVLRENINTSFLDNYIKELGSKGIILTYENTDTEYPNSIKIPIIEVPDSMRGQGVGKEVMLTICNWADDNDIVLHLVPAGSHKNSRSFLISWYGQFGFVVNTGKEEIEDLSYMYRLPKTK